MAKKSSRIYQSNFSEGNLFKGSQQSRGFNQVQAIDTSAAEKEKARQQVANTKTLADQYNRQAGVTRATLSAQQAQSNANFAAVKGLLSLSQTAMRTFDTMQKQQEAQAQKEALEQEQNNFLFGGETPRLDKAAEREAEQDGMAIATRDAATSVSDDPQVQADINRPTADAMALRSATKITTFQGSATIGLDVDSFMTSNEVVPLPGGGQIVASEARTNEELTAAAAYAIQKYSSEYGFQGMDPKVLRETYLPAARRAFQAAITNRGAAVRAAEAESRAIQHYGAASSAVQSSLDPNRVYQDLYNGLKTSNVSTSPKQLNQMVREHMINTAKGMGPEGITYLERMKGVQQVPGQKGSELGKGPYAVEIDKAIRAIRSGAVTDYRQSEAQQAINVKSQQAQFQRDLMSAETEEQRVQLAEQYESTLETQALSGNQAAFTELQRQRGIDNRYDPNLFGTLMDDVASGKSISQVQLNEAMAVGSLTPEQAKSIKAAAGDNFVESVGAKLKPYQSGWKKRTSQELLKAFKIKGGSQDRAEVANYADDATRILNERMGDWMSQNEEASPAQIAERADRMIQEIIEEKVVTPQGALMKPVYDFGTPQVPTKPYTNPVTGRQARNLQFMTTDQLQALNKDGSADNDLDIYNDTLITQNQFAEEVERMQAGSDFSPRIKQLARLSGVTPRNLVYAQAVGKGVDLDSLLMKDEGSGVEPTDIVSGTRYLQTLGFSARGSAYLAANIQQESSWNGMRSWGGVFNPTTGEMDGTSRNGGLISWASWANAPARLGAIENYLGKPIDKATHSEQLRAMVWEMETNSRFANARRTFRDPNATDAQLRRASYEYWGYGHEGVNRFGSYLDQALSAING